MAYTTQSPHVEHSKVKAEKFVKTAVGILERESVLSRVVARKSTDLFRGAKNDTITVTHPGVLPWREYEFRNDRSSPIVFDALTESKTDIKVSGHIYSGTRVTDEQRDFDDITIQELAPQQASAVVAGLEKKVATMVTGAPYSFTVGGVGTKLRDGIIEARKIMNALGLPQGRVLLVGPEFEAAILRDKDLTLAQNVGDSIADSALRTATVGALLGFRIVTSHEIAADSAIAMVPEAFNLFQAAPSIPQGVIAGSTFAANGFALRWIHDYEPTFQMERSVVDTWCGTGVTKDWLVYRDASGQIKAGTAAQFVRAIKLTLGGKSDYPAAASEVALFSGLSDAAVWTPTGYKAETAQP